ncbi:MAG: toxin-antitoxin system TumE family protein [Anaerolineae bacterium]
MKTLSDWLEFVITTLQTWPHCHSVRILETQQFSKRQFAFKVRATLVSGGTVQVRLYHNDGHTDYAYHVICGEQSVRWDNKEHFSTLQSHPHHFHAANGHVEISPLTGNPDHDLPLVLDYLVHLIAE